MQRRSNSSSEMNQSQQQQQQQQQQHHYELVPPVAAARLVRQPDAPRAPSGEALRALDDAAIVQLIHDGRLAPHTLEAQLGDLTRAVRVRRASLGVGSALDNLPFEHYSYEQVVGACAENVLGYVPVPIGVAGPVLMDGKLMHIPMATTEGCLIASTHRGCKAITESGGAVSFVSKDGMTRASAARAGAMLEWLSAPANVERLRQAFQSTTRFGKLVDVQPHTAGRTVYVRFLATTGDAMGMNMISKGVEKALETLSAEFPDAEVLALSGNVCTDKKPAAINWINGRGKSVTAEAVIKRDVVQKTLKTTVPALVELNVSKNLVGSALAGSIGGNNAHASNIVTAMYIACGQDPAQVVESANCITLMEQTEEGDLRVSVTMPSIECATVGGGTNLKPQRAALELMGIAGASATTPGDNARQFARAVAVATLSGELSLMSALSAGHLVKSHMALNRPKSTPAN
jgi:hydroxymethylglutaryl-CoA reductase (NADPH)